MAEERAVGKDESSHAWVGQGALALNARYDIRPMPSRSDQVTMNGNKRLPNAVGADSAEVELARRLLTDRPRRRNNGHRSVDRTRTI